MKKSLSVSAFNLCTHVYFTFFITFCQETVITVFKNLPTQQLNTVISIKLYNNCKLLAT